MIPGGVLRAGAARPQAARSEGHLNCLSHWREAKALPSEHRYPEGHLSCATIPRGAKALPLGLRGGEGHLTCSSLPGRTKALPSRCRPLRSAQSSVAPRPVPRLIPTQRDRREGGCRTEAPIFQIPSVFRGRNDARVTWLICGRVGSSPKRQNIITREIRTCMVAELVPDQLCGLARKCFPGLAFPSLAPARASSAALPPR